MLPSSNDLKATLASFKLVISDEPTADGALRLQTPFKYSDGALVDLFLYPPGNNLLRSYRLTDLGQTASLLFNMDFNILSTHRRKAHVDEICHSLNVLQKNGEFYKDLQSLDTLAEATIALAQACIRVSDMALNLRIKPLMLFKDDLEEAFYDHSLSYESPCILTGPYGNSVNIDFKVYGVRGPVLIEALATQSSNSSHSMATEAFVKWSDLSEVESSQHFVTVYSTEKDVFKKEDLKRLEQVSKVYPYPEASSDLLSLLCAA